MANGEVEHVWKLIESISFCMPPVPPERVAIGPVPDRRYFAKPAANGSRSRTVPG